MWHTVNATIAVLIGLPDHLVDLLVRELLADRGHDVAEFGCGDEAVVVAVKDLFVELVLMVNLPKARAVSYLESFPNLLLRIRVLHLAGHHRKKLWLLLARWPWPA
jgi:hypothetical protein